MDKTESSMGQHQRATKLKRLQPVEVFHDEAMNGTLPRKAMLGVGASKTYGENIDHELLD